MIIFFGQILSILLCSAGTASQKLVTACGVKIPAFQGFLNYCLLTIVFTSKLAYNSQEFLKVLKERWWKYILIGCIDVEANYMVYKAYAYTSLTSVQVSLNFRPLTFEIWCKWCIAQAYYIVYVIN